MVPAGGVKLIPAAPPLRKPVILQFSTCTVLPLVTLIPISPVPAPSIDKPRRITMSVAAALTLMALVPDAKTPAKVLPQSIVIDLVMVMTPKPPGSRQLMIPPATVCEMAPAKVLHGAMRLHGLASSPTPETQVRVACAWAGPASKMTASTPAITVDGSR